MVIKTNVELQPMTTPNYILCKERPGQKQEGFVVSQKFHVSELDPETLSALCDQFRAGIFKKAHKEDPKK